MATKNFFASSTAVQINAFPNKPVRFEDLNFNNLLMAFKTTWVNPETNLNTDVFQVQILEGSGSNVELIGSTYLFPALGATLADFLAILEAQATNSSDYFAIYQDMYAISNLENTISTRDVIINKQRCARKVYTPVVGEDGYTTLYMNAGQSWQYLKLFVVGDQESAFDYYYAYYD